MRRRPIERNKLRNKLGRIVRLRCEVCGCPKGIQHFRRLKLPNARERRSTTCKRCEEKTEAQIDAEALSERARLSWS